MLLFGPISVCFCSILDGNLQLVFFFFLQKRFDICWELYSSLSPLVSFVFWFPSESSTSWKGKVHFFAESHFGHPRRKSAVDLFSIYETEADSAPSALCRDQPEVFVILILDAVRSGRGGGGGGEGRWHACRTSSHVGVFVSVESSCFQRSTDGRM